MGEAHNTASKLSLQKFAAITQEPDTQEPERSATMTEPIIKNSPQYQPTQKPASIAQKLARFKVTRVGGIAQRREIATA
jgi:hypothetical protein